MCALGKNIHSHHHHQPWKPQRHNRGSIIIHNHAAGTFDKLARGRRWVPSSSDIHAASSWQEGCAQFPLKQVLKVRHSQLNQRWLQWVMDSRSHAQTWLHQLHSSFLALNHVDPNVLLSRVTSFSCALLVLSGAVLSPGDAAVGRVDATPHQAPAHRSQLVSDMSSEFEEQLMEAVRQLEAGVDDAVDMLTFTLPPLPSSAGDGAGPLTKEELESANQRAHELIQEVWEVVELNYWDARRSGFDHDRWRALRDEALARGYRDMPAAQRAVRSMLAKGLSDPYTKYLSPPEFSTMYKYDVTGIGLNLGTAEEFERKTGITLPEDRRGSTGGVWVVGIIKGSAADRVGIQQGDQLLSVDGQLLDSRSPFQAASLIQGGADESPAGAAADARSAALIQAEREKAEAPKVELKVRKPDASTLSYAVSKPSRSVPSPVSEVHIERKRSRSVGYLKLDTFNARAQRDVVAAVKQLEAQGADEFVLDLRDNRGGLVTEGIEVAKLFLPEGSPIVYTKGRRDRGETPISNSPPLTDKPLTVMVNERSASASEILAGALKDNCRAVLAGNQTYGKGLIQSVYALSDGSGLITTVGKYLTPSLTDIDLYGIKPEFKYIPSPIKREEALNACRLQRDR